MHVAVGHHGRPEQQGFERTEPRQRHGLVGRDLMAMRHAARVGGRMAHVERQAAHQAQHRVGVDVDEAGHDHAAGKRQARRVRECRSERGCRSDGLDALARDRDDAALDQGRRRVAGQHGRVSQNEVGHGFLTPV